MTRRCACGLGAVLARHACHPRSADVWQAPAPVAAPRPDGSRPDTSGVPPLSTEPAGSDSESHATAEAAVVTPSLALRQALPALRADRTLVAALEESDLGARGVAQWTLEVLDVATDRVADEFLIAGPDEVRLGRHPRGEGPALAYLALDTWTPLVPMTIEDDPLAPSHQTDPAALGATSRARRASLGTLEITYREPSVSVRSEAVTPVERSVPRWLAQKASPPCPRPWALIRDAWAAARAGVAIVAVEYQGIESDVCWTQDATLHVVTWHPSSQ